VSVSVSVCVCVCVCVCARSTLTTSLYGNCKGAALRKEHCEPEWCSQKIKPLLVNGSVNMFPLAASVFIIFSERSVDEWLFLEFVVTIYI
jgi:hypothetical protein